jgi:hypothetical protein
MGAGAAAAGFQQQPMAAAGAVGFDDAAFGPVDDWRVLGDVQQWHRTLLTKEKVRILLALCAAHGACVEFTEQAAD